MGVEQDAAVLRGPAATLAASTVVGMDAATARWE